MKFHDTSPGVARQSGSARSDEAADQRGEWFFVARALGLLLLAVFGVSLLLH